VPISSVTGLGLTWAQVKLKCAGRNTTGIAVWMAEGNELAVEGAVTAMLASAATTAVIAVSRFSGVSADDPIGNVIAGNMNGLNATGVCSGGADGNSYSFDLNTTVNDAVVYAAIAIKGRTHNPGAGYIERTEIHHGSGQAISGIATESKHVAAVSSVTVNGALKDVTDWALVALEIKPEGASYDSSAISTADSTDPSPSLAKDQSTTAKNESSSQIHEPEIHTRSDTVAKRSAGTEAAISAAVLPNDFVLAQNLPNPFNPRTQIRFGLPAASHVTIKVFNINGAEVATLVDDQLPGGTNTVVFNAGHLPTGTYFYVMQAGEARQVRRLLLVK
jgi:hypothetical protein